jgi:hypothetical protein
MTQGCQTKPARNQYGSHETVFQQLEFILPHSHTKAKIRIRGDVCLESLKL